MSHLDIIRLSSCSLKIGLESREWTLSAIKGMFSSQITLGRLYNASALPSRAYGQGLFIGNMRNQLKIAHSAKFSCSFSGKSHFSVAKMFQDCRGCGLCHGFGYPLQCSIDPSVTQKIPSLFSSLWLFPSLLNGQIVASNDPGTDGAY